MSALPQSSLIAVVGAGAMGAGIAQVAAQAGHEVLLYDAKDGAAEAGLSSIVSGLDRLVAKGRLEAGTRDQIVTRLKVAPTLASLAPADLVIEAIVEDLAVKRTLFSALEAAVDPDTILATNTSSLSVTAIAAGLTHPDRVAGLHFFNPAPLMALVEIVSGLASDQTVLETLYATAIAWGKIPVHAKSTPGFIVNRVARPFYAEGLCLLEEGTADAATLDAIMREAGGFRMGPFELMDLIGNDVNFAVTRSVFDAYFADPRYRPSLTQQELVAAGWYGRKVGKGFYDYAPGAAKPQARVHPAAQAPSSVLIEGSLGAAEGLYQAIVSSGIPVQRREGRGLLRIDGATLALTDGRTATARVASGDPKDLVLFDLALDYPSSGRIALAKADQAPEAALATAAGLFQALGKNASVIDDVPGLVVMRTVAMLANEAAEAAQVGVASHSDIDRAMTYGVNYPKGPLAWTDAIGPAHILGVLEALHDTYGDDRYRPSLGLRRRVATGLLFHSVAAAAA